MKSILFVDDESRILEGLKRMLRSNRERWYMQFAGSGEEALRLCQQHDFDIVISDMRMPGMDGVAFLRRVRDLLPNAARIILTGYSETTLAIRSVSVAHRALAKPCDPSQLQSVIERVIALEELVSVPEIRKMVGAVGELPALSQTYACLTKAVMDPDISIVQISRIIEQDVALSAKILQLTNSAFFGLSSRVSTIAGAVSFLGIETIKNLALSSEAFSAFKPDRRVPESFYATLQSRAMETAGIAGRMPLDPAERDSVLVAALLHDIGELFLASKMPLQLCEILQKQSCDGRSRYQIEEEVLGTSHAEIGAYLLGLWGIPAPIVEIVVHHHRLDKLEGKALRCAAAVYIAQRIVGQQNSSLEPPSGAIEEFNESRLRELDMLSWLSEFCTPPLMN